MKGTFEAMYKLSNKQMLPLWEDSNCSTSVVKAIVVLQAVMPNVAYEKICRLSIGKRNKYLLKIIENTFGPHIPCLVHCPHCKEALEFKLNIQEFYTKKKTAATQQVVINGLQITFRPITTADLLAISSYKKVEKACIALSHQCILEVKNSQNETVKLASLSQDFIGQLAEHMQDTDPQAETILNLHCPCCEEQWQMPLDIVNLLWNEITVQAKRLLDDIHCLALSYGWCESTILAVSNSRRQAYLEKIKR